MINIYTRKIMINVLQTILLLNYASTIYGYTIRMYNKSNTLYKKDEIHVHDTTSWCPDSRNEYDLEPLKGEYTDVYSSMKCGLSCFDWFEVKDQRYYIPLGCQSLTIEIRDDGVYLNGSKPHPYDCYKVPGWGIELAGKKTAMETAKLVLKGAEGFLEKVGKPIATTGALAVRETGTGVLKGAREASVAVLSESEDMANFLLTAVDIQKLHWDGSLQDFATGRMGNFQIAGKIFDQDFDLKIDLDIQKGFEILKDAANKIVAKMKEAIDQMAQLKVGFRGLKLQDDMIKLTLQRNSLSLSVYL